MIKIMKSLLFYSFMVSMTAITCLTAAYIGMTMGPLS